MHRLDFPTSTPNQNKIKKTARQLWKQDEQHENKEELKMKITKNYSSLKNLCSWYQMMANSWSSSRNHVKNGAEAMDWDVQDPPRSYGDLEGAWCVWEEGGSASPMVGDEDED